MEQFESNLSAFQDSHYFWDWITLGCGIVSVAAGLFLVTRILGLPGRIAIARNHPDAEAVYAMGWVGFLAIVPWIQAFIWAFKPTDKVDIRRFPDEEQAAEKEELARLRAYAYGEKPDAVAEEAPPPDPEPSPDISDSEPEGRG